MKNCYGIVIGKTAFVYETNGPSDRRYASKILAELIRSHISLCMDKVSWIATESTHFSTFVFKNCYYGELTTSEDGLFHISPYNGAEFPKHLGTVVFSNKDGSIKSVTDYHINMLYPDIVNSDKEE